MVLTKLLILLLVFKNCLCHDLDKLFQEINNKTGELNAMAANIAWESAINPGNPELPGKSATYQKKLLIWQQRTCHKLGILFNSHLLNDTQRRQTYLMCRGPKFTFTEARLVSNIYEDLQSNYSDAKICIPTDLNASNIMTKSDIEAAIINYLLNIKQFSDFEQDYVLFAAKIAVNGNLTEPRLCLNGENDFEKVMEFSRKEEVLRWLWLTWREKVGPPMKEPYKKFVYVENMASWRNGYSNIGASWRDELEIPHLRQKCRNLYNSIQPLYKLLHGVVRFYLRRYYGEIVPRHGLIPAHLLGNLWSQNWESLSDMILPKNIDLDKRIRELNWTVEHMVRRAEDFYQSLGLPAMTDTFWRKSVFEREKNSDTRCHGTAADMFQDGDYRLLYCAEISKKDFHVLHHELGHIQYYMAYSHQPAVFRQANAALHEAIGDIIMYGVLTPQHLNRLGLINDSVLYTVNSQVNSVPENDEDNSDIIKIIEKLKRIEDNAQDHKLKQKLITRKDYILGKTQYKILDTDFKSTLDKEAQDIRREIFNKENLTIDMILLFKIALNKIPQIPFSLVVDEYRWKYFDRNLGASNKEFWSLVEELQGVAPPGKRGEEYFDIGAIFHVPDNTPYIRYFLSSFLQYQIFEKLCKASIFGRRNTIEPVPSTIGLSRCDIYGSKTAGKILKDLMSRGHSQHWSEILKDTINESDISASALIRYYQPLYEILETFVRENQIPIGW